MDINADLGELEGATGAQADAALLGIVTTAHVACGAHAGDSDIMRRTVAAAVARGVVVGAHPSYPDREGFGRLDLDLSPAQVHDEVAGQVAALLDVAAVEGAVVRSVKPHGALYNRMAGDEACAAAVAAAVAEAGEHLVLVTLAGSRALTVAGTLGVRAVAEAFCDRGYLADGTLAQRGAVGAAVTDPAVAARRAAALARGRVEALDGSSVAVACQTLCVHGDTPGAAAVAWAVRRALEAQGVPIEPFAPA